MERNLQPGHRLRARVWAVFTLLPLLSVFAFSQQAAEGVNIQVHFDQSAGHLPPIWNFFGYDEPNYTYAPNGKKLLSELGKLSPVPVYVRTHNLFTTGDGSASLKWGSTNVYTEDAAGKPIYSWAIVDKIFDAYHDAGVKPLVEVGFMPQALSTHPEPYRHSFPDNALGTIFTGWAYPPKDYEKWSQLVFKFTQHLRERYGDNEVKTWLWEVWNEPDIPYWQGTPEEYFKLYDVSVDAILKALPGARVGGPDSTGPGNQKAADFLRAFLDHCAHQKNYVTGKTGSHLDFISFHPKGSPKWLGDHVQMGIARQLAAIEQGFQVVASFPEWKSTPIVLGESDPEGCAACSAKNNPQNSYRNGPLYASYTTEVLNNIYAMAEKEKVNFLGAVTWAFEFEDQPPFAGFRELATNGIDKPVLNSFRMFGMLGDTRVKATSSAALAPEDVVKAGVRDKPEINVLATREEREIEILVWNYHDDDVAAPDAPIDLTISGLPSAVHRVMVEHYRIDAGHSNAYAKWKELGAPESPSAADLAHLQDAGQLQLLDSPEWKAVEAGSTHLNFALPRQGISMLKVSWSRVE
jgi:xylan 1,4-beta-xylosidase